jgi:hypothetical protein
VPSHPRTTFVADPEIRICDASSIAAQLCAIESA